MFSHLCRCCLTVFSNSSDIVPLFERHKNMWYHRLITATFRVSLAKDDNLGTNICKSCATEVLKSYKFHLKYFESERNLRQMLDQADEDEPNRYEALFNVKATVSESAGIVQANIPSPSDTADFRWKCNKCAASFPSRSQYRDHRRLHPYKKTTSTMVENAEVGTEKQKLKHEKDQFLENEYFHEPAIVIEDYESAKDDLISSITPEMDIDIVKNESRFIDQEPDVDLGLYLIEKHSQIHNPDPLEGDNLSNSLLIPINETSSSHDEKNTSDINNKWKCRLCDASFRTRELLREHKHMEAKQRPQTEIVKEKKRPNSKRAKFVDKSSVNVAKWQCDTCLFNFATRKLLRIHCKEYLRKNEITGRKELQCIGEKGVDGYRMK